MTPWNLTAKGLKPNPIDLCVLASESFCIDSCFIARLSTRLLDYSWTLTFSLRLSNCSSVWGQIQKCILSILCSMKNLSYGRIKACLSQVQRVPFISSVLLWLQQAKFDHNLVNRQGDNPLMVACSYGNVEVLRFLLRSAIQSLVTKEPSPGRWVSSF